MSARKRYRPTHRASPLALTIALQGVRRLDANDIAKATQPAQDALKAIAQGVGSKEHWQALFDVLNVTEEFSRNPRLMRGATDYIHSIQRVIAAILDRHKETGTKALYPSELADLRGLVDLWAEVLTTVTCAEYFKATETTHNRLIAILRSKTPGVRVMEAA